MRPLLILVLVVVEVLLLLLLLPLTGMVYDGAVCCDTFDCQCNFIREPTLPRSTLLIWFWCSSAWSISVAIFFLFFNAFHYLFCFYPASRSSRLITTFMCFFSNSQHDSSPFILIGQWIPKAIYKLTLSAFSRCKRDRNSPLNCSKQFIVQRSKRPNLATFSLKF